MTRDEIAQNVATNLNSSGYSFFSGDDINASIQDAYDDLSTYCGQIEKSKTVAYQSKLVYYDFSSLISDFYAVTAIYDYNKKRWLIDNSTQALDQVRWDWENWSGGSIWFIPHDPKLVALCPRQDVAVGNMEVFYRAKADTLSGTSVPKIKSDAVKALEFYATGDLLESAKEYAKADVWLNQYLEVRERYKSDVKTLSAADRIIMIQQNSMRFLP